MPTKTYKYGNVYEVYDAGFGRYLVLINNRTAVYSDGKPMVYYRTEDAEDAIENLLPWVR